MQHHLGSLFKGLGFLAVGIGLAGKVQIFLSSGLKSASKADFLGQVRVALDAGATGLAVGRTVWKGSNPIRIAYAPRKLVLESRSVDEVFQA